MLVREGLPVKDLLNTGRDLDKVIRAWPATLRMNLGRSISGKMLTGCLNMKMNWWPLIKVLMMTRWT